jgi:hypothetical protein
MSVTQKRHVAPGVIQAAGNEHVTAGSSVGEQVTGLTIEGVTERSEGGEPDGSPSNVDGL